MPKVTGNDIFYLADFLVFRRVKMNLSRANKAGVLMSP